MKNPNCFQVTYSATVGMASHELTSHDGPGASGPSRVLTSPFCWKRNSQTPTTATLAVTYGT